MLTVIAVAMAVAIVMVMVRVLNGNGNIDRDSGCSNHSNIMVPVLLFKIVQNSFLYLQYQCSTRSSCMPECLSLSLYRCTAVAAI